MYGDKCFNSHIDNSKSAAGPTRRVVTDSRDILDVGTGDVRRRNSDGSVRELVIHATINGLPCQAVLDPGASRTLLPRKLLEEAAGFPHAGNRPIVRELASGITTTSFSGETSVCTLETTIRLRYYACVGYAPRGTTTTTTSEHFEREFEITALVSDVATEFLLGCDTLFDKGPLQELQHRITDPTTTYISTVKFSATVPPQLDEHGDELRPPLTRRAVSNVRDTENEGDDDELDASVLTMLAHHTPAAGTTDDFREVAESVVVNSSTVSDSGRQRMVQLLIKHRSLFVLDKSELPSTLPTDSPVNKFHVRLKDPKLLPPRVTRCHYGPDKYGAADAEIDAFVTAGIYKKAPPGTPAYSAGHLVTQKGKSRLTSDSRHLNNFTVRDPAYVASIERNMTTQLHAMQGCNVFSEIDLAAAFTGMEVAADSIPLMTVMTHRGPYYVIRTTFGAADVPAAFQHEHQLVYDSIRDEGPNQRNALFVDDTLIGATIGPNDGGLDEHLHYHDSLFHALFRRGWRISLRKCLFLASEGAFCGAITDGKTVRPDPKRTAVFAAMLPPTTFVQLRRVVGVCNWWAPDSDATEWLRLRVRFEGLLRQGITPGGKVSSAALGSLWDDSMTQAFERFKAIVCASTRALPDPRLPIYGRCDASSDGGCSANLIQFDRVTGKPQLLASFSHVWSATQRRWPPGRMEAYAPFLLVTRWATKYMMGLPLCLMEADANNLSSITDPSGNIASKDKQIAQWATTMLAYPFVASRTLRQPGPANDLADLTSRLPTASTTRRVTSSPIPGHTTVSQLTASILAHQRALTDKESSKLQHITTTDLGKVFLLRGSLYVPDAAKDERLTLLRLAHDSGGHVGIQRTSRALSSARFDWATSRDDIAAYCKSCVACQLWNAPHSPAAEGLSRPTQPPRPGHTLYLDFYGPFGDKRRHIVNIVDAFTRYIHLIAADATTAAEALRALERVRLTRGGVAPLALRVDSAKALIGRQLNDYTDKHGTKLLPSPPYAHHTLGMAEGKHKVLADMAKALWGRSAQEHLSIQADLDHLALLMNTAHNREIGMSPYYAQFGQHARTPLSDSSDFADIFDSQYQDAHDFTNHLAAVHELTTAASSVSKIADAASRDAYRTPTRTFARGDLVSLWFPASSKWEQCYRGPYRIASCINESWYNVSRLVDSDYVTTTQVSVARLRPFDATRMTIAKLLALDLDGDYAVVVSIDSHRARPNGELEFQITWHNDMKTWTTAPDGNLHRLDKFRDYIATHNIKASDLKPPSAASGTTQPTKRGRPPKVAPTTTTTSATTTPTPAPLPASMPAEPTKKGKGRGVSEVTVHPETRRTTRSRA
jgi:hypothetical protein